MLRIKDILKEIERFAPLPLQEDFDNAGVQVGDINQLATGAIICLDVTEEVITEALDSDCNLIISHHPLAFKPFKSLKGATYVERCMMKACKHDLVIYAAHTNLDNAIGGVNYRLAELLGLQNVRVLSPQKQALLKLVTYVPDPYAELLRNALFNAGAGHIGNYDSCSYNLHGEGTYRAHEGTHPFRGKIGELHYEGETRIETILPAFKQAAVTRALLSVHPYEEPAYDFYPLKNNWEQAGSGVVGELPASEDEMIFLNRVKAVFNVQCLKHSKLTNKPIREVALCGGSGAFLLKDAIAYGADVFITGEAKYNDFYDVEDHILLAVIGHYESEVCTKDIFYTIISKKFPNFAVHFSNVNSNPVNYL
ncbi:Nif3-like dinuclear metal center hexameric protein [Parabacteroides sp. OttesenSCG-928-G07]|nr:Nif3-like dinuclear metal center hexameric protein [Parabacteroides sp. OttesenSCG-928-G21]MDL2278989.1 Nif3-like dinuclear metal center hexameric protein [Parabacteroides sp. OttesenSCG-928-G07]